MISDLHPLTRKIENKFDLNMDSNNLYDFFLCVFVVLCGFPYEIKEHEKQRNNKCRTIRRHIGKEQ